MRTNQVLMAVVTASVMAITLAGCGGEGDAPKVPTAGGDNASAASGKTAAPSGGDDVSAYVNAQREWVKCLRENGVDAPDPDAKGQVDFGDNAALKKDTKFLNASEKCASLVAAVPESLENANQPKLTPEQIKVKRDYAACMQKNGAPDFPDPGPDGTAQGSEWDQTSAGAKRATRVCAPIIGDPVDQPEGKG
jgi:outer membrane lipopolysaccharide assembly protein LptE/RlpB